jgi:hypothetical protein
MSRPARSSPNAGVRPNRQRKTRTEPADRARPGRNLAESPVAWLFSRRDSDGNPLISEAQFNAGERLRADFWFAQMSPNVTQSWNPAATAGGGRRSAPGAGVEIADNVVAAAERVRRAGGRRSRAVGRVDRRLLSPARPGGRRAPRRMAATLWQDRARHGARGSRPPLRVRAAGRRRTDPGPRPPLGLRRLPPRHRRRRSRQPTRRVTSRYTPKPVIPAKRRQSRAPSGKPAQDSYRNRSIAPRRLPRRVPGLGTERSFRPAPPAHRRGYAPPSTRDRSSAGASGDP